MARPNPPSLSSEQRAQNGALAVLARRERAQLKIDVASKNISFFDVLTDGRESIKRMKVIELLEATPGVGKRRAEQIMSKAKISLARRIAGLGRHQIEALRKELVLNKLPSKQGLLIVMSGPGGVGKSTISQTLKSESHFWISVSATTRRSEEHTSELQSH